jgi:hypothetical protein
MKKNPESFSEKPERPEGSAKARPSLAKLKGTYKSGLAKVDKYAPYMPDGHPSIQDQERILERAKQGDTSALLDAFAAQVQMDLSDKPVDPDFDLGNL